MKRECNLHWVEAKAIVRDLEEAGHSDKCFDGFIKKLGDISKDAKTASVRITVEAVLPD